MAKSSPRKNDDKIIAQAIAYAVQFQQQGMLGEAEKLYAGILRTIPHHFDALHLLGVLRHQQGNNAEAVKLIDAALKVNARSLNALSNFVAVLTALGRHDDALAACEKILSVEPNHLAGLLGRGNALMSLRRFEAALAPLDKALAIKPDYVEAVNNRGNALMALDRFEPALAAFDQALALKPDHVEALINRGNVFMRLERPAEALPVFDQAIGINPDNAFAHNNRGVALAALARHEDATASYDRALALNPGYAEAHNNRGNALLAANRIAEALAAFENALAITPENPELIASRGSTLLRLNRFEDALAAFEQALAARPDDPAHLTNRGAALLGLNRIAEAQAAFEKALGIKPDHADAYVNIGNGLLALNRHQDALASYATALAFDPYHRGARMNEGILRLSLGDFRAGWRRYEARLEKNEIAASQGRSAQSRWRGEEPLAGRTILLYAEQGLGDTIHFVRYAPLVAARGARVVLEVQPALKPVLSRVAGVAQVLGRGEELPAFDVHCPLMSLPHAFGTELDTIPADIPYVTADPDRVRKWKGRLPATAARRIGIAWSGNPLQANDRNRSIGLRRLAGIFAAGDFEFVSIQKELRADDADVLRRHARLIHLGDELADFADTAALMSLLDLVISVDTSVAHLAGAMGRPVWILLPFAADYRWMHDRADSPWYPTARLFRQPAIDDWDSVVERVRDELIQWSSAGDRPPVSIDRAPLRRAIPPVAAAPTPFAIPRPLVESGNIRVRQTRYGLMAYNIHDFYIGRSLDFYGEFSHEETKVFGQFLKPRMTVIDVGANIGAHTLYFAQAVGPAGHVTAFEPQPVIHRLLCANLALNEITNARTMQMGVGRENGHAFLPAFDYTQTGNFGGVSLGKHGTEQVPIVSIDSLGLEQCHFIKVDVEGMEEDVLVGAAQTAARCRPVLYVENDRRENSPSLIGRLVGMDYALYWHTPPLFSPDNLHGNSTNIFPRTVSLNVIGVPREVDAGVVGARPIAGPQDWPLDR
jgi:FkbM family methyltransferase